MKNKKNYLSSLIYHLSSLRSGFTLIELLIAISIIGILSGILLANFVGARQRARDGVRKSDLRQIQSALELYRADKAAYPSDNQLNLLSLCSNNGSLNDGGDPPVVYMRKIPCDPTNTDLYIYTYKSFDDGNTYDLYACLENINDSQKDSENNANYCNEEDNWSYTLQNP